MEKLKFIIIFMLSIFTIPFSVHGEEHKWISKTVEPTITTDGYTVDICENCNEEKNKKMIPAMTAKIVRVVDGDTIVVKTTNDTEYKVRFIGVNTPESVAADSSKNTPEGIIASNYTKKLLTPETTVYLEYDESYFDIYGRILAYPWLTDISDKEITDDFFNAYNIGAILLQNTYCESVYYKPNGKYKTKYDALYKIHQPYTEVSETAENKSVEDNKAVEENIENKTTEKLDAENNKEITPEIVTSKDKAVNENNTINLFEKITQIIKEEKDTKKENTSKTIKISKPSKVKGINGKKKTKKRYVVTWKETKNTEKYELQMALSKNMKKNLKSIKTTGTKITITKFKRKRTYYFRVRAINSTGKGKWSRIIKIKSN